MVGGADVIVDCEVYDGVGELGVSKTGEETTETDSETMGAHLYLTRPERTCACGGSNLLKPCLILSPNNILSSP
jgi:hypothetical protein